MVLFRGGVSGCRFVAILSAIALLATTGAASLAQQGAAPDQAASASGKQAPDPEAILNLDIDQLAKTPVSVPSGGASMDLPVTSVTKEQSTVGHSAAAVFVITPEMIRRSGATNIPDVLRMVPGLDVAQANSNTWAISSRGFNWTFGNK